MSRRVIGRDVVVVAALVGMAAAGLAAAISLAQVVGATPAQLFGEHRLWSSLVRLAGVPIEAIATIWFVGVALLYARLERWRAGLLAPAVFFTAGPLAGMGLWFSLMKPPLCWPILLASGAAAGIMGALAIASDAWNPANGDAGGFARDPVKRASTLAFLALAVLSMGAMHTIAERVTPDDAFDRDFHRWYLDRATPVDPDPAAPIRIVLFTDYQAPDRYSVPARIGQIDAARQHGLPVELVIRDFPRDRKCNVDGHADGNDAACEAAYAARLVTRHGNRALAQQFRTWLYERGPALSETLVHDRLRESGLLEQFVREYDALVAEVARDITDGRRMGVSITPTWFVSGVELPSGTGMLRRALRYEDERRLHKHLSPLPGS